jgi:superfamily II DNA or RNA helicase
MPPVHELVQDKSALLLDLENAKRRNERRQIVHLASLAAVLEGQIAREFLLSQRPHDAIINFISEASCYVDAERFIEARRVLSTALELAIGNKTEAWLREQLARIPDSYKNPALVFQQKTVNIHNNDKLRRPQREAFDAVIAHFRRSREHAIIQLPVGCGKTGAISILPFGIANGRMLVVAPNLEIRDNLLANLDYTSPRSFLRNVGVLTNGSGPTCAVLDQNANLHDCDSASIVVTNIQQLVAREAAKWLGKFAPDFFDVIVLDEGHHNVAPTWKQTVGHFPEAKITSFTATPLRADGQKVEGQRIYRFPISDAIREGYVKDVASRRLEPLEVTFTYEGEKRRHTLEEVMRLKDEDWFSRGIALAPECNKSIVDHSLQCMEELRATGKTKHQIVAVACSIDHAKAVRALYEERGYRADVIHSNLEADELDRAKSALRYGQLDAVVQVQMLAEGADYPNLSVAAIFRPFRHLVPYTQFIGRIMRVAAQDSPGHPDNRGYVVSHVGLNVDRWWEEMRQLDEDDQEFFEALADNTREFLISDRAEPSQISDVTPRRRFRPEMVVLQETISHFVQEKFLPEDAKAVVDDVLNAMALRGIDLETLGITRKELEERIRRTAAENESKGKVLERPVQPQRARLLARKRLDERVRSASKQLLNELKLRVNGFELPRMFPKTGATNNIAAAIVLLNLEVMEYLKAGASERDLLTTEQLVAAHDNIDTIIDRVAAKVRGKLKK